MLVGNNSTGATDVESSTNHNMIRLKKKRKKIGRRKTKIPKLQANNSLIINRSTTNNMSKTQLTEIKLQAKNTPLQSTNYIDNGSVYFDPQLEKLANLVSPAPFHLEEHSTGIIETIFY